MLIHVKLYAGLRRHRPDLGIGQTFDCAVPDDATVGRLFGEALRLPPEEFAIALVNGIQRDREYLLRDGDQVSLWPPIAGGAGAQSLGPPTPAEPASQPKFTKKLRQNSRRIETLLGDLARPV